MILSITNWLVSEKCALQPKQSQSLIHIIQNVY